MSNRFLFLQRFGPFLKEDSKINVLLEIVVVSFHEMINVVVRYQQKSIIFPGSDLSVKSFHCIEGLRNHIFGVITEQLRS